MSLSTPNLSAFCLDHARRLRAATLPSDLLFLLSNLDGQFHLLPAAFQHERDDFLHWVRQRMYGTYVDEFVSWVAISTTFHADVSKRHASLRASLIESILGSRPFDNYKQVLCRQLEAFAAGDPVASIDEITQTAAQITL